ncbi:MAG TPA: HAD family hydrolase [Nitrospira sp.]|nr:HAD family hydrolase [Nitrospira sp.]
MRRAVFLDKDGTLVEDEPPNTDTSRVRFYSDVFGALRVLKGAGYALIVVTNQSGIAQGRCEEADVRRMQAHLQRRLEHEDLALAGFYYCPHDADGIVPPYAVRCECRKPRAGLLLAGARDLGIDLAQSWMVGDILHDIEAGRTAGCRTVLVNNGHETEWRLTETRWPDHITPTLLDAARLIASSGERTATGVMPDPRQEHR